MRSPVEFPLVFEQGPGRCLLLAPEAPFTVLAVTDAFLRSAGRTREGLVGGSVLEVLAELPALRAALERVRMTKETVTLDSRLVLTPIRSTEGEVHHVHLQLEDVTDRLILSRLSIKSLTLLTGS